MRKNQQQEINTLDRIIEDSPFKKWDGINNGASGEYKRGLVEINPSVTLSPEIAYFKVNGAGVKKISINY